MNTKHSKDSSRINLKRISDIVNSDPSKIAYIIENRRMVVLNNSKLPYDPEVLEFAKEDWGMAHKIILNEILSRDDRNERYEPWECKNIDGHYDFDIMVKLLERRKNAAVRHSHISAW